MGKQRDFSSGAMWVAIGRILECIWFLKWPELAAVTWTCSFCMTRLLEDLAEYSQVEWYLLWMACPRTHSGSLVVFRRKSFLCPVVLLAELKIKLTWNKLTRKKPKFSRLPMGNPHRYEIPKVTRVSYELRRGVWGWRYKGERTH